VLIRGKITLAASTSQYAPGMQISVKDELGRSMVYNIISIDDDHVMTVERVASVPALEVPFPLDVDLLNEKISIERKDAPYKDIK
jgi:hypothetical protein